METKIYKQVNVPNLDYTKLKVILIGVSKYPDDQVSDVPNIKANVNLLKRTLTNSSNFGVPSENIFVSLNKTTNEIINDLTSFVCETENDDTILVYYSGHGFISDYNSKLYLSTTDSNLDDIESTSISIERFVEIISLSNSNQKIVILDSCYSGHIHNLFNNPESSIYGLDKSENLYVISSSSGDEPSYYPLNSKNSPTYFTGELIKVLQNGIENGKSYITLNQVYTSVKTSLKNQDLPSPQRTYNGNRIVITRNNSVVEEFENVPNSLVNIFTSIAVFVTSFSK
ncbi:MAG: caspase family protein [Bacteroidales bacterium]|nr:caspase family protein [Bacteroidales bacterium]